MKPIVADSDETRGKATRLQRHTHCSSSRFGKVIWSNLVTEIDEISS